VYIQPCFIYIDRTTHWIMFFKKRLPFCASKYNVAMQEKVVNRILKLVAQCKMYFPFNLKVNFAMNYVQKKNQHRLMSNRIRQLLPTLIVLFHFVNIYILKNVEISFVSRKKNGLELNEETSVCATSSTERMRK
jgi:hypothetical protein